MHVEAVAEPCDHACDEDVQEREAEFAGVEAVSRWVDSRDGVEERVVRAVDEGRVEVGDGDGRVEGGDLEGHDHGVLQGREKGFHVSVGIDFVWWLPRTHPALTFVAQGSGSFRSDRRLVRFGDQQKQYTSRSGHIRNLPHAKVPPFLWHNIPSEYRAESWSAECSCDPKGK